MYFVVWGLVFQFGVWGVGSDLGFGVLLGVSGSYLGF